MPACPFFLFCEGAFTLNSLLPPNTPHTPSAHNAEQANAPSDQTPPPPVSALRARRYALLRSKRLRANIWPLLLPIIIPMLFVIIIMGVTGVLIFRHSPAWGENKSVSRHVDASSTAYCDKAFNRDVARRSTAP